MSSSPASDPQLPALNGYASLPAPWPVDLAQAAVQASHDLLLVVDRAATIRQVNGSACRVLQASAAHLIGASFLDLLDEGSRAKGRALLEQARHGSTGVFELNQTTPDGQIVMIGYHAQPLPGGSDGVLQVLLVGQPLAATITATTRLIGLNRRLNALFNVAAASSRSLLLHTLLEQALAETISALELSAGAILLTDTPLNRSEGAVVEPGQLRFAVQQGLSTAFVSRLSTPQHLPAFWNDRSQRGMQSVVSGSPEELGLDPADLLRPIGPLLTIATTPLVVDDQLIGWLYGLTDRYGALQVDELELLQTIGNVLGPPIENARLYQALHETSGQLQAVLDTIDSGVLLIDTDGVVRYANARLGTLLNADVRQWPGQPRERLLPATLRPLTQGQPIFEGELWELAGEPRRVLRRYAEPVIDDAGAPVGSIEVFSDVTQIQQMAQIKDEFVAAAAHDLKTPVTAIKGYTQIALRIARRQHDERLVQQLAMVNARSDELTQLMDALLDMSRIQAGRIALELETFALADLLHTVTRHFDFDLQRRNRRLLVNQPPEPLNVTWDRARMTGVLINLIGNALKYSPDGQPVEVRVEPLAAQHVQLLITDHGIGIPAEERERIFDRFYRVRSAVEQGFKGTGIGLYISRYVVELHGGQIHATDALHGAQGVTMMLELPRVAPSSE
jgi:two-component system, OmpR family, phosphate regulon sensor histidine kinase PhoR